ALALKGLLEVCAPSRVCCSSWCLSSAENVTCHRDGMQVEFSRELSNSSWHVCVVGVSGEEMLSCDHTVHYERLLLRVPFVNCTRLQHGQHQLWVRLLLNDTVGQERNVTLSTHCATPGAERAMAPVSAAATNCTRDFMAVSGEWERDGCCSEAVPVTPMSWNLSVDDGTRTHQLSLGQAMQKGYNFLIDGPDLTFQVAFAATGVVSYRHKDKVLHTVALKLLYGPPERGLAVEARLLCAPGPAICNATHMTVAIPAFPGTLVAVDVENKSIPMDQLQEHGITLDTHTGIQLHISRAVLKSRLPGESCSGLELSMSSLKLAFLFHGTPVAMVIQPECPCEQHPVLAAVCTHDGFMDFEVLAESTVPPLDLDTLRLRDPACRPAYKSPLNDRVWFHVPLNGCGTRFWFDGEKIHYENEVRAFPTDLPLGRISRDSDLRLTVVCSFSNSDASLTVKVNDLPPVPAAVNQGSLSLVLLSYPEASFRQPYSEEQFPIVRYLRQPIFLEVQVLNRNDPNVHLVLDDCWATGSPEPRSVPQWNIVVDGCEYALDSYRTVFHPVGRGVSYANYRQRLEVKTFAFVSGGRALPGLVYFHCSVLLCDRFHPDAPLCIPRCPRPSRSRRGNVTVVFGLCCCRVTPCTGAAMVLCYVVESRMAAASSAVVSLQGPVLLVPEEWSAARGSAPLSREAWAGIAMTAGGVFSLATMLLFLAVLRCLKRRAFMVNVVC
ncbi:ZP2 protein, partial [Malurus elegans]|nr:ZP2 protein [Malurus elegans]